MPFPPATVNKQLRLFVYCAAVLVIIVTELSKKGIDTLPPLRAHISYVPPTATVRVELLLPVDDTEPVAVVVGGCKRS
jgi:hypothetical protein